MDKVHVLNARVGDTVRFNHVVMDGLSSVADNGFGLVVMAKVCANENTATTRNTGTARMKEFLEGYVKDRGPGHRDRLYRDCKFCKLR